MWNAIFRHDRKFGAICHKEEPKTVGKIGIFRDLILILTSASTVNLKDNEFIYK